MGILYVCVCSDCPWCFSFQFYFKTSRDSFNVHYTLIKEIKTYLWTTWRNISFWLLGHLVLLLERTQQKNSDLLQLLWTFSPPSCCLFSSLFFRWKVSKPFHHFFMYTIHLLNNPVSQSVVYLSYCYVQCFFFLLYFLPHEKSIT